MVLVGVGTNGSRNARPYYWLLLETLDSAFTPVVVYGFVVKVMAEVKRAGVTKLGMVTEPTD